MKFIYLTVTESAERMARIKVIDNMMMQRLKHTTCLDLI